MLLMFAEQLGEARRTGGRLEQAALWARAALDAIDHRAQGALARDSSRPALRTAHHGREPGFHRRRHPVAGPRHRRQHRDLQPVERRAARLAAGRGQTRTTGDALRSGRSRDVERPLDGRTDGPRSWLTYGEFEQLRDHAEGFSELMASQSSLEYLAGPHSTAAHGKKREAVWYRADSFRSCGVRPAIGRLFTAADDRAEAPYAVISYSYWQRRFGGRPDVLGRTITLRKVALTIIGVTPLGFIGETSGQQPDLWLPLRLQPRVIPARDWLHDTPPEKVMWLQVFGRLKPGVTHAQAEARQTRSFSRAWSRSTVPLRQVTAGRIPRSAPQTSVGRAWRVVDAPPTSPSRSTRSWPRSACCC